MARERRTNLYPAQIRYQQRNPMVSFRIPKAEYDHLKEKAKNSGISLAELARKNLREPTKTKDAHEKGYREGFETAKREAETKLKQAREKGYEDGFQTAKREAETKLKQAREKGYEEGAKISKKRKSEIIAAALKEGYEEGYKQAKSEFESVW